LSSWSRFCSHRPSLQESEIALYSASVLESKMVAFFLDFQEMEPDPRQYLSGCKRAGSGPKNSAQTRPGSYAGSGWHCEICAQTQTWLLHLGRGSGLGRPAAFGGAKNSSGGKKILYFFLQSSVPITII
jgi:hypothetical protein